MRTIRNKSAPSAVTASVGDREVPVLLIGERRFVKVEDVAQALGTPAHHVIRHVRDEKTELRGQKLGRAWLLDLDSFYKWFESGKFAAKTRRRRQSAPVTEAEGAEVAA